MEPKMRDADQATQLIVDIASTLIRFMQSMQLPWSRAFVRFEMTDPNSWRCNGSYETTDGVTLFDPHHDAGDLYTIVNDLGYQLRQAASTPEKEILVFLLSVDSGFDYQCHFESEDQNRWKITKLDGGTGLPQGYP